MPSGGRRESSQLFGQAYYSQPDDGEVQRGRESDRDMGVYMEERVVQQASDAGSDVVLLASG